MAQKMTAKFKPDLVIMAYVTNDAEETQLTQIRPETSALRAFLDRTLMGQDGSYFWYRYSDFERMWLSRWFTRTKAQFSDYSQELHRDDARGWILAQNVFSEMKHSFAREGVDWFYVVWPMLVSGPVQKPTEELYEKIVKAMKEKGAEAYNLLPYFQTKEPDLGKLSYGPRDCHPNAEANRLLSEFLADRIIRRESFQKFLDRGKTQGQGVE